MLLTNSKPKPKLKKLNRSSKSQTNLKAKLQKIMSNVEIIKEEAAFEFQSPYPLNLKPKATHKVLRIEFPENKERETEEKPQKTFNLNSETTKNEKSEENLDFELFDATFSDIISLQSEVSSMNFDRESCFSFNNFSKDELGIEENKDFFNENGYIKLDYSPGILKKEELLEKAAISIQKNWKAFVLKRNYRYCLRKFKICQIMLELIEGRRNDEKNKEKQEKFEEKIKKILKAQKKILYYIRTGKKLKKNKGKNKKKQKK